MEPILRFWINRELIGFGWVSISDPILILNVDDFRDARDCM